MKHLAFHHSCTLLLDGDVFNHYFTLRITPCDDPAQTVHVSVCEVDPVAECSTQTDGFGNLLYVGSFTGAHDSFSYHVEGEAEVDSARGRGTELNEIFRYPSPLTQPGPALAALHAVLPPFDAAGSAQDVFMRVLALRSLVHKAMSYEPGTTTVATTAEEAAAQSRGVCQDEAHILVALCRMDGIPARYITGLMWGEGFTHAWVEFFDGTTWWGMDPTNDCEAGDYYIVLARGRDHADCPMESGVFRGAVSQRQRTKVLVEDIT